MLFDLHQIFKKIQYSLPWTYPAEIKALISAGSTVLDIGCGDGHLMAWINSRGEYKVVGVDINKKDLEVAKKRVIVAIINGFFQFDHRTAQKHDLHLSGWSPQEFTAMGYRVWGSGLRIIYKPGALKDITPPLFHPLLFLISYLATPLVHYLHQAALLLIAHKDTSLRKETAL